MVSFILFGVAFLAAVIFLTRDGRDGRRLGEPKMVKGDEGVEPLLISGEGIRASGSGDGPMCGDADKTHLQMTMQSSPTGDANATRSQGGIGECAGIAGHDTSMLVGTGGADQPDAQSEGPNVSDSPENAPDPIMIKGSAVDPGELIEFDSDTEALVLTKAFGAPDPTLGLTDNGNGTRTLTADGKVVAMISSPDLTEADIVFLERGGPVDLVG
jgi:hypothetical protein